MLCVSCGSGKQIAFPAEMNIHHTGLHNLDKLGVFLFPNVLVCLDCGYSRFTTPETELELLASSSRKATIPEQQRNHHVEFPVRNIS
jgi:hypothetical protein